MNIQFTKIVAFILIFIIAQACEKEKNEDIPEKNLRVISEVYSSGDQVLSQVNYEYIENRISKISTARENYFMEETYAYPTENQVVVNYSIINSGEEDEGTYYITLEEDKIVEKTEPGRTKEVYGYNADGQIKLISYYTFKDDWVEYSTETFSYKAGNLEQHELTNSEENFKEKNEYSYIENEIFDRKNYFYENDLLIRQTRDAYVLQDGKISKIRSFFYHFNDWILDQYRKEYSYNNYAYLVEYSEVNNDKEEDIKKTVYSYEEGIGNLRQLSDYYFTTFPRPMK